MAQKKSPYSVVIFHKDRSIKPIKYPFVSSIYYVHRYLLGQNVKGWVYDYWYMNVYNRKTGQYLRRQYANEYIVDKPLL